MRSFDWAVLYLRLPFTYTLRLLHVTHVSRSTTLRCVYAVALPVTRLFTLRAALPRLLHAFVICGFDGYTRCCVHTALPHVVGYVYGCCCSPLRLHVAYVTTVILLPATVVLRLVVAVGCCSGSHVVVRCGYLHGYRLFTRFGLLPRLYGAFTLVVGGHFTLRLVRLRARLRLRVPV